jgi:hypothetical protein
MAKLPLRLIQAEGSLGWFIGSGVIAFLARRPTGVPGVCSNLSAQLQPLSLHGWIAKIQPDCDGRRRVDVADTRWHTSAVTGFDIIGDVHGCADKLTALLKKLGYSNHNGSFRHSDNRQAVFVGDLIDRGPFQLESVAIPRAMVEHGAAQMVIGNHEFNAVAFATRNADDSDWCRPHNDKNRGQHQAFLDAVEFGSAAHRNILDWFMSLPLWLELDNAVRVVHACWHDTSIVHLKTRVGQGGGLTDDLVRDATTKGPSYDAIEAVLKGPEVWMDGYWYEDRDGHKRTEGRAQWWKPDATTLRDIVRLDPSWPLFDEYDNQVDELPAKPFTESVPTYPPDAPPVLFGHYWFTPKDPMPSTDTTACIDFSAVKGGTLVAYRWDGQAKLRSENFVSV